MPGINPGICNCVMANARSSTLKLQAICRLNNRDARSSPRMTWEVGEMIHCGNITHLFFMRAICVYALFTL
jgi:hypothetical protein